MKKILIFLAIIFTFAVLMPTRAEAYGVMEDYEVYDDIEKYASASPLDLNKNYNVIKGVSQGAAYSNDLYQELIFVAEFIDWGDIICDGQINYNQQTITINGVFTYDGGQLTGVSYSYNGTTIYELTVSGEFPTVVTNKELHLFDLFEEFSEQSTLTKVTVNYDSLTFQGGHDQYDLHDSQFEQYGMNLLYGSLVKYNTKYENKECHLVTEHLNPLPINELLKGIKITDLTDGVITDYQVISNEYDHLSCSVGAYSARIIARDKAGNAVVQDLVINVVDAKGPIISAPDIETSYTKVLNAQAIKDKCSATDDGVRQEFSINADSYLATPTGLGSYEYSVTSTDKYGNTSKVIAHINVIDDIAPVISTVDIKVDAPYAKKSKADILANITVIDEKEGAIAKESIELKDLNDYEHNFTKLGKYVFSIAVRDSKSNLASGQITIMVVDENSPVIEFQTGAITIDKGSLLSKQDIINILKQTGQLAGVEVVALRSAYFDEENPNGSYTLEIELSNGELIKNIININERADLLPDIDKPEIDNPETNKPEMDKPLEPDKPNQDSPEIDYSEPDIKPNDNLKGVAITTMVTLFGAALASCVIIFIKKRH